MSSSIKQFTQSDNIKMLWDLVSEEDVFTFLDRTRQAMVYDLFLNNIKGFYDSEQACAKSLMDLNKKYILLIITHIKTSNQTNKIKIHSDDVPKELITFEEIQTNRKNKFERDLMKKKEEFEDSIHIKVPPLPDFSDKHIDTPIKELDKMLKEMQSRRNYDIEQITHTQAAADSWLTPQETSLKSEKITYPTQKKVTFYTDEEEDLNIFAKLKVTKEKDKEEEPDKKRGSGIEKEDRLAMLERRMDVMNKTLEKIVSLLEVK